MVPFVFFTLVASSSFVCSFAIFMDRSRLTSLKQRGVARWNTRVLVPIPPYSSGGRGSGVGGSFAGEQKRDHRHGEGGSSRGERQKYTRRLDIPAKAASSCKVGSTAVSSVDGGASIVLHGHQWVGTVRKWRPCRAMSHSQGVHTSHSLLSPGFYPFQ